MVATRGPSRGALMQRLQMLRARNAGGGLATRAGGPVPGLPGVRFGSDISSAMQKAAASSAQFHSGNLAQMEAHPAVGWSRGMAGTGADAMSAIEPRLAEAGIVRRPDGSWTIAGRPSASATSGQTDVGVITPSVLRSRTSEMTPATVNGVPQTGGQTTIPASRPAATPAATPPAASPAPAPGTGQVPGTIGRGQSDASGAEVIGTGTGPGGAPIDTATISPGSSRVPIAAGPVPTQSPDTQPAGTRGANILPSPGLGGGSVPTDAMNAAVLPTNRSSGIWPTVVPGTTLPQPTLEQAAAQAEKGTLPYPTGSALMSAPAQYQAQTTQVPGTLGTGQSDATGAGVIGTAQGPAADPNNPATAGGPPIAAPQPGLGGAPPAPVQQAPPQQAPAPAPAPTQPPPRETPPAAGPPSTPTVAPGANPGSTTPSRPGVPSTLFEPGFPFNDRPGGAPGIGQPGATRDLSTLGETIANRVKSRMAGAVSPASPGSPAGEALTGLGERIRSIVSQGQGEASRAAPGAGGVGLGPATTSIMDTVRRQLAQNQVAQNAGPAPAPLAPAGPAPAPTIGQPAPTPGPGAQPVVPTGTASAQMSAPYSSPQGNIGSPTGTVPTGNITGGMSWDDINQWDPVIVNAAAKYPDVDPAMVKSMLIVESGGNPGAMGVDNATGLMQIKPQIWQDNMPAGIDLSTPEGQIEGAFAILSGQATGVVGNTPEERFLNSYYPVAGGQNASPVDNPSNTQAMYLDDIRMYTELINGAAPPTGGPISQPGGLAPGAEGAQLGTAISQPGGLAPGAEGGGLAIPGAAPPAAAPAPAPIPGGGTADPRGAVVYNPQDPAQSQNIDPAYVPSGIVGSVGGPPNMEPKAAATPQTLSYLDGMLPGSSQAVLNDPGGVYGFGTASGCPGCYDNYYGWDPNAHTGLDVATNPSVQEPFTALVPGKVVCVGSADFGNPGTATGGCGAYPDYQHGGLSGDASGNLMIETPDGALVTYGHTADLAPGVVGGGEVVAGQEIGITGSQTGPNGHHVHLEVRLPVGPSGEYILVDPNVYFNNGYCSRGYCSSAASPIAQPPGGVQTNPVQQSAPAGGNGYYTGGQYVAQATPAPGLGGGGYTPAPAPQQAMPAPAAYDSGVQTLNTGQVTTDAAGRQYELMADGTSRLIYDPAW